MTARPLAAPPLADYAAFPFRATVSDTRGDFEIAHMVYRSLDPGRSIVLLMHELPGITRQCLNLAAMIRSAGFQVVMPLLYGTPGRRRSAHALLSRCIRREFAAFSRETSCPIGQWMRALTAHLVATAPVGRVGAIGMCLTGNLAVLLLAEKGVDAAVTCQPAPMVFPLFPEANRSTLGLSEADLEAAAARAMELGRPALLGYRFSNDLLCPAARFRTLKARFGSRFQDTTIPAPVWKHAVLTLHFDETPGSPTQRARDEILAFLSDRLLLEPAT